MRRLLFFFLYLWAGLAHQGMPAIDWTAPIANRNQGLYGYVHDPYLYRDANPSYTSQNAIQKRATGLGPHGLESNMDWCT